MGVVGGDHSVPLGLIRAVAGRYPGVGILHVDAHADLPKLTRASLIRMRRSCTMRCTRPRALGRWCRWAYAIFATRSWRWPGADERGGAVHRLRVGGGAVRR
ncbi:MAG: arginase family protein [Alistipes sp.]